MLNAERYYQKFQEYSRLKKLVGNIRSIPKEKKCTKKYITRKCFFKQEGNYYIDQD